MTRSIIRTQANCLAASASAPIFPPRFKPSDWRPEDPRAGTVAGDNTLDRHIAQARREMGEVRWAALQKEWEYV